MPPAEDPRVQDYREYLDNAKQIFADRVADCLCPSDDYENYELLNVLGRGGFGRVYEARRKSPNQIVALKLQLKSFLVRRRRIDMILREKVFQWAMQSPFIVPLIAAFKDYTYVYMTMEFAALGSLNRHVYADNGLPQETARLMAGMIVLGLEYLHACSILYRDLKPENVVVYPDGYVKLSDFGLSVTHKGFVSGCYGTAPYMAPETFLGDYVVDGVDWWAFGVTLYEMYSRAWVFGADPDGPMRKKLIQEAIPIFIHATVPDIVCDLVGKLLIKNVTRRLGSMENGADDVKNHPYFEGINFYDLYEKKIPVSLEGFEDVVPTGVPEEDMPEMEEDDDYAYHFREF